MQINQLVAAQLLLLAAGRRRVVELHFADCGAGSFHLKEKERAAHRELIPRRENSVFDRDAVDEGARGGVQVGEYEAFAEARDAAMPGGDSRIIEANWIGRIAPNRYGGRKAEFGFSQRAGEGQELKLHG